MKTILFVESGSGNGGSAACLVTLVRWLDPQAYRPIVAHYAEGVHIERIRQLSVETFQLHPRRRLWQLVRLIRARRVHLIHNNNRIYTQMSTMAAAALTRIPCVCTLRVTRGLTRRERVWVPFVRHFIAVSESTRQAYVRSGIPEHRIQKILDGIDLERFSPTRHQPRDGMPEGISSAPNRLTVGLVSRLIPVKGIEEFLRAARHVVDRFPAVQFLIVGGDTTPDGRYDQLLKALTSELRLTDHVMFTGWRADLDAITPLFDIAAQASKYWEGLGISLLEAMACGKPAVATSIGGVTEVVEDGQTGLLVSPGDSTALGEALLNLLRDESLRRRMGDAARRRVEQHFDQRRLVKEVERVYEQVLNEG
ncbi:MAG: glycosyltransferase family 4 protein [Candidatus Binatia bacterium]